MKANRVPQKAVFYDAIFFSPHLDDAVLSLGGTIAKLTAKEKKSLIVAVFTQGENQPISKDGKDFLKRSGEETTQNMFKNRKIEDKKAARILSCDLMHLDFKDAIFRLRKKSALNCLIPRFRFVYPSYKVVFRGKVSKEDKPLQKKLRKQISSIIKKLGKPNSKVYGPLGIGGHVDHIIIFEILLGLKLRKLCFWEDLPYNDPWQKNKRLADLAKRKLSFRQKKVNIKKVLRLKEEAASQYVSQIAELRHHGLKINNYETLYINQ